MGGIPFAAVPACNAAIRKGRLGLSRRPPDPRRVARPFQQRTKGRPDEGPQAGPVDVCRGRRRGDLAPFAALRQEIASLAQEPAGAGLDLPDWLEALEDEVSMVRCARRHRQPSDDELRRVPQIQLSWQEWQQQIADDSP